MATASTTVEKEMIMALNGAIVKTGATAMTPTGGADMTLSPDSVQVPGGIHLSVAADTDYRTRRNMTIKAKNPTLTGGVTYSKDKKTVTFVAPKILTTGETVFNLIRIEREVHPASTAAEALELNMIGAQILSDSDFASFFSGGSLA
jgi:hypothetical protein